MVCPRKFTVVNLVKGVKTVSILRQGLSIMKDTNSDASQQALVLVPDPTDLRPGLLSRLQTHH